MARKSLLDFTPIPRFCIRTFPFHERRKPVTRKLSEMPLEDIRIVNKREVLRITGWSVVTLFRRMRDGKFPEGRRDGQRVVWYEHEVRDALDNLFQPGPCTTTNLTHVRKS